MLRFPNAQGLLVLGEGRGNQALFKKCKMSASILVGRLIGMGLEKRLMDGQYLG